MENFSNPTTPAAGTGRRTSEAATGLVETAKEKAQDLMAGAGGLVSGAREKVQEWTADAADAAGRVGDKARELAADAADHAKDWGRDLTALIRRYPIPALMVGFAAGFLAVSLLRRD